MSIAGDAGGLNTSGRDKFMAQIEIKDPSALWYELRRLMDVHYKVAVPQNLPFGKEYPRLYRVYLSLGTESPEVRAEVRRRKLQGNPV